MTAGVVRKLNHRRITRRRRSTDPVLSARSASLHYVTDQSAGIRRVRSGTGFSYRTSEGRTVRDAATLKRIRSLVIPPAWTEVWICPRADGHLQATGRDARGRKQYRYHPDWRVVRDESKFERLAAFARALPRIRRVVQRDLARDGIPREKAIATIVRLLETTFMRVGNEEYAKANGSFGLTTLRDHHARVSGTHVTLKFRGKSGKTHSVDIEDRRLARIVKRCRDLPGQILFQYIDDAGNVQPVQSSDVNEYLRTISGSDFTAKDFRTWAGTVLAARELSQRLADAAPGKTACVAAVAAVATALGNTPAVCRKCYIHPAILAAFIDDESCTRWSHAARRVATIRGHSKEESVLLRFLAHPVAAAA